MKQQKNCVGHYNTGRPLRLALMMLTCFSQATQAQFTQDERGTLVAGIEQLTPEYKVAVCYLQPNKGIYETGEDLWFKAYLLDAQYLLPFKADTTLYVQVVPITGGKAVLQEKILLLNGFGSGHIYVSDSLPGGDYYLQAFSAHSYVRQSEFKDQRKITIKKSIIPAVKIDYAFDKEEFATADSIRLQITLKTRTGARITSADVSASSERNGHAIESIKATTDRLGNATLTFKPADTISGTVIAISTSSKEKSDEQLFKIPVPYKVQHLHFYTFPEGGYLVRGLPNVLAFKAMDETGVPVEVKGTLLEDDQPLLSLGTIHDGMGKLSFVPQKDKQYKISLEAPYSDSSYQLQNLRDEGVTLSFIGRTTTGYAFRVAKNSTAPSSIFLRAQIRGKVYSLAKAMLKDSVTIVLPPGDFPQGIAEVTLFNASMNSVAERLVYINPEKRLHIEVDSINPSIGLRQRQQLKIKVTDEAGMPVVAHLGVSVYDTLYRNNSDAKNIFTHYYIDNGLKGNVYNPAWYFDKKNKGRYEALDLLLMTHGWRRYVWSEKKMKEFHPKQIIANDIEGTIAVYQRKKKLPGPFFTFFFAPDNKEYKNFIEPDSAGNFTIKPYDLASAGNGYIYAKVTPPEGTNVNIKINNPFVTINQSLRTLPLSYPKTFHWPTKQEEPGPSMMDRALLLEAVVVKARSTRQFRDKYMGYLDSLTKADMTSDYIEVRDADSASYRTSNKIFTMNDPNTKSEWRRKPIEGKTYSILYYKGSPTTLSNWKGGAEIFDDSKRIIYHYPKLTEEELLKKYNLGRVKGYNIPREFFSPDYENSQNVEGLTDYRNALYWKPDIITNERGEAVIKFFSSDISSGFTGIIEGVDGNGLLGNDSFEFKVKGK